MSFSPNIRSRKENLFMPLVFLLDKAYVCTQPFKGLQHGFLLFPGDAIEHSCLNLAVCCANSSGDRMPGRSQRDERVAIILWIEATTEYSFCLKLLDQASNRGAIKQ